TMSIGHNESIGITIQGNTKISAVLLHSGDQLTRIQGAYLGVDIKPIRLATHLDNLGAQLAKHMRGNMIGGTVGGIDHNFIARQIQVIGEGALAKLYIAASRIDDPRGTPQTI